MSGVRVAAKAQGTAGTIDVRIGHKRCRIPFSFRDRDAAAVLADVCGEVRRVLMAHGNIEKARKSQEARAAE